MSGGKKRRNTINGERRKVDAGAPPRVAEEEVDELLRENRERNARLEDFRLRFGPLRGDVKR